MRTYTTCRFSNCVADGDRSTSRFEGFSSKWRTRFSHLRGGSYNHAVVQKFIYPSRLNALPLSQLKRAAESNELCCKPGVPDPTARPSR
jgi:hypothetical protein